MDKFMEVSNYDLIGNAKLIYLILLCNFNIYYFIIEMDKTTERGFKAKYVAECILKSVLKQEKEVTIALFLPKCVIVLRTLFPSCYFWIMQKRAIKLARDK